MCQYDVKKLIEDCGGVAEVAKATGKNRTQPYRWVKTNKVTTEILASIKCANPEIDLNEYVTHTP